MDQSLQPLLHLLEPLSGQFLELRDGVQESIKIAAISPEMALTRARKVLEYLVRDVYERRINAPAGTQPLEKLLERLVKDHYFPVLLDSYAAKIRKLGNAGTHNFTERVKIDDVYRALVDLLPILEWYFEFERPEAMDGRPPQTSSARPTEKKFSKPKRAALPRMAIVPKGLRSFDANDADFFLELLPGARDKNGLPESIRFWKHRIEAVDETTFTVGVLYGPSGCGKSSLVKAGLLPRLAAGVLTVATEATADDTEARLLKGLRKQCPDIHPDSGLVETLTALRGGQGMPAGKKVLIVIDQFEQWLHAKRSQQNTELAQALRQCDGEHVQCLVLVRDDFWLALSRFMSDVYVGLVQDQNIALVDLFDQLHARNVLAAFGRAFGRLNDIPSKEEDLFLDQAIRDLAQDGRVISVRLALFAEMMKGKPWTPSALKALGGTEGVGVAFLEESFGGPSAPLQYRPHQKAILSVLKALLPEAWTDIKGHMRSYQELLEASEYADRPKEFQVLLQILDNERRLITPIDLEGVSSHCEGPQEVNTGQRFYQLTHDYLVPSIREWLIRKQRESRQGRAELRLAIWSSVWNNKPENRNLPSWWEWVSIRLLTMKDTWTAPQRKMMQRAGRVHCIRSGVVAAVLIVAGFTGLSIRNAVIQKQNATRAEGIVDGLMNADITQVPSLVDSLEGYRSLADPLLKARFDQTKEGSRQRLNMALALLPVDATQVEYLYSRMLTAEPHEFPVVCSLLADHKDAIIERLWGVAENPDKRQEERRLRAACALAQYDPTDQRWTRVSGMIVEDLVSVNPIFLGEWSKGFRPVRASLLEPLSAVFRGQQSERTAERNVATNLLIDYAADNPQVLADLLMDANEKQFALIFPKFKEGGAQGFARLTTEISRKPPSDAHDDAKERLAKRQANAGAALFKMNQTAAILPLLKHTPDPRVRSYLIHCLQPLGADPGAIFNCLDNDGDITIRQALLQSLGEFSEQDFRPADWNACLSTLHEMYRKSSDAGLHASAEWLLRKWKNEAWLKQVNEKCAEDGKQRLESIERSLAESKEPPRPQWFVNGQVQTMVVIPGPIEFVMGSPLTELSRSDDERQHKERIGRTFAIAATSVTAEQYRKFDKTYHPPPDFTRTADLPVVATSWFQAASYCNWLSQMEGIPKDEWCYGGDPNGKTGPDVKIVTLKANYLRLKGYRLPTEAEMEYATRAGSLTSRFYGETEELLPKYAWFQMNSHDLTWPVGSLKPNDFGLFDVQGNVFTWCQEAFSPYPHGAEVSDDKEDDLMIDSMRNRALRGGWFINGASLLRSALRHNEVPTNQLNDVGFRLARTLPL